MTMEGGQEGTRALMTSLEEHLSAADACKGRGKHDEQSSMASPCWPCTPTRPSSALTVTTPSALVELYLVPNMSMVDDYSVSINILSVRTDRGPCSRPVVLRSRQRATSLTARNWCRRPWLREKGGYFWRGEGKRLKGERMKGKRWSTGHGWLVVVQMTGRQRRLWTCGCAVGFRGDMFDGYHTIRDGLVELYFASDVSIGVLGMHADQQPHDLGPRGGLVVLGSRRKATSLATRNWRCLWQLRWEKAGDFGRNERGVWGEGKW
uniref:Uncharacterized protein n=1 Tax=Oryza rufipogon TaxID=4529 RepID=A0A0E0QJY7_ORYRU